jgi:uncharacterized protein (TIGR00369 family)
MASHVSPRFEHFDREIADRFLATNEKLAGLPAYLGARFVEFEPGRLVAELEAREELQTPFGNLHGGVLAAFVDHVLGCVLYPHMKPGSWAATTEFKINYLAPVASGRVVAESTIVSLTRSTAVVRIEVVNQDRLVAIAQGTVLIREPRAR